MAATKDIAPRSAPRKSPQDLARELRLVMSVVITCVAALRHQNAEQDQEMALVLMRLVSDPLSRLIDELDPPPPL